MKRKFLVSEIGRKSVIFEGEREREGEKYAKRHVAIRVFRRVSRPNSLDMGKKEETKRAKRLIQDVYTLAFKRPKIIYTHNFWLLRM